MNGAVDLGKFSNISYINQGDDIVSAVESCLLNFDYKGFCSHDGGIHRLNIICLYLRHPDNVVASTTELNATKVSCLHH